MPNLHNQQVVKDTTELVEKSQSIVIADYSGLNVAAQNKLRAKVTEVGGQFTVVKNRLFKVAFQKATENKDASLDTALEGQNAFLFGFEDAVAPIKALFEFAKENEALKIKIGVLDGRVLTHEETEALSKLPSKKELIAKLIGQLQAPAYGLVNVLSAPTRNLVYAINAIKTKKETN